MWIENCDRNSNLFAENGSMDLNESCNIFYLHINGNEPVVRKNKKVNDLVNFHSILLHNFFSLSIFYGFCFSPPLFTLPFMNVYIFSLVWHDPFRHMPFIIIHRLFDYIHIQNTTFRTEQTDRTTTTTTKATHTHTFRIKILYGVISTLSLVRNINYHEKPVYQQYIFLFTTAIFLAISVCPSSVYR